MATWPVQRQTVTFPAAGHHRRPSAGVYYTGTKLYCLVNRGTCTTYPRSLPDSAPGLSRSGDLSVTSLARYCYTTKPHLSKVGLLHKYYMYTPCFELQFTHWTRIYRVFQKTDTQFYFWDNFGNSAPILTILSLLQAKIYGA